jgi:hypothetical protein
MSPTAVIVLGTVVLAGLVGVLYYTWRWAK